ncbi:hypothetical protein [Lentimicrobium sp. S6]|uniref:hypothetical protein n=2 Tax=unclassified Lentimicrobium TaxID=2677434 RepID=UPI0015580A05|nr:hypothetical protein [Lentimicrobium sp. S6]NPD46269.1 hypothetical protein [Lentimicrobium sp. S6]
MKKWTQISLILLLLMSSFACKRHLYSDKETVLARVGESYLYLSELSENIPRNINNTDSIQMLNSLVDNWVRKELLLQHADKNLPDSLKDFSEQLRIYENSLTIYEFKKKLVNQRLDTVVETKEIEKYYEDHLKDFQLKDNILQFAFIQIPIQSDSVDQAKEYIQNIADTALDRSRVEVFCQNNAIDYYLNDEHWISFNELIKRVPIETYNQELFLENNKFIEIKDHPYWYFANLRDFKIKEDVSPLNFEKDHIRNIILNRRKLNMLNSLENDIYEEATRQQQFEIY